MKNEETADKNFKFSKRRTARLVKTGQSPKRELLFGGLNGHQSEIGREYSPILALLDSYLGRLRFN